MRTRFHTSYPGVNDKYRHALCQKLLRWYNWNRRDLPWRQTHDPYKIWISEIMLQQTRVEVVRDYYNRWIQEFPTVQSLAAASSSRVLKQWEGLGYYNRARNLHRTAQIISGDSGGLFPKTAVDLKKLPGIGRYTAGAIASIAFDESVPVVDGNVLRLFSRLFCIPDDVSKEATKKKFWAIAERLVPSCHPGDFNQAVMELGALICTPQSPSCSECPLLSICKAASTNSVSSLPNRRFKPSKINIFLDVIFLFSRSRVLLQQRPSSGILAGFWDLPLFDPLQYQKIKKMGAVPFSITNSRGCLLIFECLRVSCSRVSLPLRWFLPNDLGKIPISSAHKKALQLCFSLNSTASASARREKARLP